MIIYIEGLGLGLELKALASLLGNLRMNVKKQVDYFVENTPSTLPPQIHLLV